MRALGLGVGPTFQGRPIGGGAPVVDPTLVLDLDFLTGTLDPRVTDTRGASPATYFGADGLLKNAAANEARFDHDLVTRVRLGLLNEEQRANIVLWNRDLTNAVWIKTSCTAAKDQTGIDGVAGSASSLTATGANATCLQSITTGSISRWQSAYVKRLIGSGVVQMTMDGGTAWTPVTVTGAWTRVAIPPQTVTNPSIGFRLITSGDSIAVDFVQSEAVVAGATNATSPIPTTTPSATRLTDSIAMTDANFTSWYNQSEGTFVLEFTPLDIAAPTMFEVYSSTVATHRALVNCSAVGVVAARIDINPGGLQASITGGTIVLNNVNKLALALKLNDTVLCLNGSITGTDVTCQVPMGLDRLYIGRPVSGTAKAMHLRRLRYFNVRKSNAEMQALTT